MIINNVMNYVFSAPSHIAALRVLNERITGISGRETARLAGLSLRTIQIALANLEALKIIRRVSGGREHLFTLNRKNFLTQKIISKLFDAEKEFRAAIFSSIKKTAGKYCISIIIFGSVARKHETADSDLDICFVYEKNKSHLEEAVSTLREDLYEKFGITLAPFYISKTDFTKKIKQNKPPVNSISKEGIVIHGKTVTRIVHG